jgi:acyl-CoA ligase (AMP-forming) (exosortase A-associated)/pyridoxal-dependent decarboxylase (exosortase A-associated)
MGFVLHGIDPTPRPLDHLSDFGAVLAPALVLRDEVLSYRDLECAIGRLARVLRDSGLKVGDRVATWLPKTVEACLMPLAAARAGLIHVPINPALRPFQVQHILDDSGSAMLITAPARSALLGALACQVLSDQDVHLAWQSGAALAKSDADPDDLAAILYTSGSTGRPKGVMLSHANLWLGALSVAHYLKLSPEDRTLCVLPLSFDYGQNQLFSSWASGGCGVPLDFLMPKDVIRAVARHDITTLAGVPPLWVQLVEADWPAEVASRIRRITNSGGALTPGLIAALRATFPNAELYPMYGLTEAFRSTYLDPSLVSAHPTSMGKAIPFAEILVVRADGSLTGDEEPGELVHCGPLVAKGYWQDAERTAERFKPAPSCSVTGGLAVWSGDTVRRDSQGLLHFVGRDDEMIKVSGNRISPTEIEEAAEASGAVAQSVALGVADERLGQSITLVARANARLHDAKNHYLERGFAPQSQRQARPCGHSRGVFQMKPMGRIPDGFGVSDAGRLAIGGIDCEDLVARAGDTPLFVYDVALIRKRIASLRSALPQGVAIHYAMKANPLPELVNAIAPLVDGLDVASSGELAIASAAHDHVSFAGPGKRDRELKAAIEAGATINLESEGEATRALSIADALGKAPRLAVRVNPDFDLKGSGMRMGGGAKPFGVDAERVPALVRHILDAGADWRGFHIFAGSQALDSDAIAETQRATVELAGQLADQVGAYPPLVNIGGGFGIPYFAGDKIVDTAAIGSALGEVLASRSASLGPSRFAIELGRFIVGEAGVYLTRIIDRKISHGEVFLITDGGLHHQLAATGNFGTVVRRNYPVAIASHYGQPVAEAATITGCLCTPLDRLADQVELPKAGVGELVAVFMAGAYGPSASPERFLGHPPSSEILVNK